MIDSMAQGRAGAIPLDPPRWRSVLCWSAALLLGALFLASGLWKITDAQGAAVRMAQARVPEAWSLPAAIGFGIFETVAAVMILTPRLRRWGAIVIGALLLAFLGWFAIHYAELRGAECSCFPWIKRMVGPGFFVGDGVMLLLALAAGAWAPRPQGRRAVVLIAGAVTVFSLVSWGMSTVRQNGVKAPDTVMAGGRAYSLRQGRVLIFFFDPECMHCFDAARKMSRLRWKGVSVVGVPTTHPEYAAQFAADTGLKMEITGDHEKLKRVFPYAGVPAAVLIENGRQEASLVRFEGEEPAASLRALRLVE